MPKKAKKSLGSTEEERLVQLQHRAQAEEEISKKKEEMLTLFLKDKLQKEQRNTAVNLVKVTDRWRSILRQARVAELRGNIIVFQQTFQREVDELNFVIEKLVGDLQGAERQAANVQASHLQHLDHLLAQDLKRMSFLHQHWGGSLQDQTSSCSFEKQQMFVRSEEQRDKLQSKVLSADQHHKYIMQEIKKISTDRENWFSSFSDPKNIELGDSLHESISTIMTSLKQNINNVKKKEEELALRLDYVSQQLKITLRLKNKAEQLRGRVRVSEWEKEFMEENLTTCRNEMNLRFYQAQGQAALGRLETKKQFTQLAVQGDGAAKKLQATITQGEKVLRAAKMGLKLKLQHEVLPQLFAPLHLPPEAHTQGSEDDLDLQRRFSEALLQRDALMMDKEDVSQENLQLQLLLSQHAYGLHEDCSPLPTSQAPILFVPAAGQQRHTVIEAAHIAKYCL